MAWERMLLFHWPEVASRAVVNSVFTHERFLMRVLFNQSLLTVFFLSGWIASDWVMTQPSELPTRYEAALPIPVDRIAAAESWELDAESYLGMPKPGQ